MVNTHTAIPTHGKADRKETRGTKKEERTRQQGKTQWCSGITCVLAKLRAHYPEHQQGKKEKKRQERQSNRTTHPTAIPTHTQTTTAIQYQHNPNTKTLH